MGRAEGMEVFGGLAAVLALALFVLLALPGGARGESSLRLSPPDQFSIVDVATYDETAQTRLGGGEAGWEELPGGQLRFRAISGIDGGERTEATALFAPLGDGEIRPMRQESRSYDSAGGLVGILTVDHEARRGACEPREEPPISIQLPAQDRIANVIVGGAVRHLLQRGAAESSLQLFTCRFGGRVVDARARVASTEPWGERQLVEVRLGADLGPIMRSLLGPWLPEISMWFDKNGSDWLGHRIPLYPQAPTVTVIRADIAPRLAPRIAR